MYEVKVRDIPARSLLCLLRHASSRQEVWDLGNEVIGMLKAQPPPRVDGVAGAAFLIYYGEVNQDSDGPVEFCWPVPQDLAGQVAASFPGFTLRTEPAHQEAYIHLGQDPVTAAQSASMLLRCPKLSGQGSNRILGWEGKGSSAGETEKILS